MKMKMKKKHKHLLDFMAKACHYAQEHIHDSDAWPTDEESREKYLQCVSYQMACFLAQNTALGGEGVEWDIVLPELVERGDDRPFIKSINQWRYMLEILVDDFGGWK